MSSTENKQDKLNNSDSIRHILQASNDILHQSIANKDIVIIATQDKADKSKFKIVADSVYEKELEGVILTFANPQDYLRLFPTEPGNAEPPIRCPPGTELDPAGTGKCIPIDPNTYTVLQIVSQPKSQTPQFHENNVLDGKEDTKWAINQKGASLTLDLGSVVDVGTVWIWWGDGDKRSFYFNIGTSQTEEQDFSNIWTTDKMSSGKVNEFEPYNLSSTGGVIKCRFIHITVNGNSVNGDWAAISNIKVTKNVAVESAEVDIPAVTTPPPPPPVEPPVVTPPPVDPNAEPPKPEEGRLQFEKGGNQDATKWKAVEMQKQPELWKIVDDKGINIADQFTKKENCEITIKWYQWKQKQTPVVVEPPVVTPPPTPTGNVTKDGVQIPYPITGQIEYTFRHNDRDDGKRMDFNKFKANTYINSAVLGYFAFPNGKVPDDEVSGKWSVEGHSDGTDPKCYDLGIKTNGGQSRYRFESPHPKYTSDLGKGKENGVSLGTKFVGYMFIRRNIPGGKVALEIWQDAGNNEGSNPPSNQWKQLAYWEDSKYKITQYPNGPQVTIRIDGSNVVKDMSLKYVSCVELF